MAKERKVCPWGCTGGKGEVAVLGAERARVPGLGAATALVRCAECQRISIAGMTTAFSKKSDALRKAESRTPLGHFDDYAWVPAAPGIPPLVLQPKTGETSARRRRSV